MATGSAGAFAETVESEGALFAAGGTELIVATPMGVPTRCPHSRQRNIPGFISLPHCSHLEDLALLETGFSSADVATGIAGVIVDVVEADTVATEWSLFPVGEGVSVFAATVAAPT